MHLPLKRLFIRTAILVAGFVSLCHGDMTEKEIFAAQKERVVVIESFNEWGQPTLQGSGVILGASREQARFDGEKKAIPGCEIVTNAHVIEGAKFILIRTFDRRTAHGEVVYFDRKSDVAILRSPFKPNVGEIERADKIEIGDKTVAIGSPKGLDWSLSSGIVSRIPPDEGGMVQTTAPISAGSSGGGLFKGDGKFIGITRGAIRDSQNLNFAVRLNGNLWDVIDSYRSAESTREIDDVEWILGHHEPCKYDEFHKLSSDFRLGWEEEQCFALWLSTKWRDPESCKRARVFGDMLKERNEEENYKGTWEISEDQTISALREAGVRISPEEVKKVKDSRSDIGKKLIDYFDRSHKEFPLEMKSTLIYIRDVADAKDRVMLLSEAEKRWMTQIYIVNFAKALGPERHIEFLHNFEKRIPDTAPFIKVTESVSGVAVGSAVVRARIMINWAIRSYMMEMKSTKEAMKVLYPKVAVGVLRERTPLPARTKEERELEQSVWEDFWKERSYKKELPNKDPFYELKELEAVISLTEWKELPVRKVPPLVPK